ncbi:hypothetical protein GQ53DRAFT_832641 [Thozetella sp. PMI_491]|nr:hypothetical protein GQ53DRAFT_832641 [Thozetella sp. PMI_491]
MEDGRAHACLPTQAEKERKPWKYEGYPSFAAWMASSNDFFLLRRFGRLNARVLLMMQDEIVTKEAELDALDLHCQAGPDEFGDCSSIRFDPQPGRRQILQDLKGLLKEYNEYISVYSDIKSRTSAQPHQVENVLAWFHNHPLAIATEEQDFVTKGADVITLVCKPKSPLQLWIEKCQPLVMSRMFRVKPRGGHVVSETTTYHSKQGLKAFATFIIVATGLGLLLGPMWALQFIQDDIRRLGLITGAVLLFTILVTSATIARPFEVLAATAAYAAVLMVFLQQNNGTQGA